MTETPISHETLTIEHTICACPAHVLSLWSDPARKRACFVDADGPGWTGRDHALDFRVGETETGRFILSSGPGAGEHRNVTHHLEIEPDRRIVFAHTMALDGRVHSASIAAVLIHDAGGGTRQEYTEQMTLIGDSDGAPGRSGGRGHLLSALDAHVEGKDAA